MDLLCSFLNHLLGNKHQHGLLEDFHIKTKAVYDDITDLILINKIRITTKGGDFICYEGGLLAILNVTTIKSHNEH